MVRFGRLSPPQHKESESGSSMQEETAAKQKQRVFTEQGRRQARKADLCVAFPHELFAQRCRVALDPPAPRRSRAVITNAEHKLSRTQTRASLVATQHSTR